MIFEEVKEPSKVEVLEVGVIMQLNGGSDGGGYRPPSTLGAMGHCMPRFDIGTGTCGQQ